MFDAIIAAGGSARRLDGADKPGIVLGRHTLLDHVLLAVAAAQQVIVVGPERPVARSVLWRRETPVGGGPVAAIAAAIDQVTARTCLVLAADLPRIGPAVPALLGGLAGHDAAVLVTGGRRNHLAAAWSTDALRRALVQLGEPSGAAFRTLYDSVDAVEVLDRGDWGRDCDTWADIAALA